MSFNMSLRNVLFNYHWRKASFDSEVLMGRKKKQKEKQKLSGLLNSIQSPECALPTRAEDKEEVAAKKLF